jgi:hypothetical protein
MRVFVYEYTMGGGLFDGTHSRETVQSLRREGLAMLRAIVDDLSQDPEVELELQLDHRHGEVDLDNCRLRVVTNGHKEREGIVRWSSKADWTILIAPETQGALFERVRLVEAAGGRLVGPGSAIVILCEDKQATAEFLSRKGVPVPRGQLIRAGEEIPLDLPFPMVLKPRDGAGSQGLKLLRGPGDARLNSPLDCDCRLEEFRPGTPVSVSFLCGPSGRFALEPCRQYLAATTFEYLGGDLPLPADLSERARVIAEAAVAALGPTAGYLGVDLVLGEAEEGDRVIEINPRWCTSYVGLRLGYAGSLARAAIDFAGGLPPRCARNQRRVRFDAGGRVEIR